MSSHNSFRRPLKTLVAACLTATAVNVYAEHGALELNQMQVVGEQIAPGNLGLETDKQEMRLTPGGVSVIEMDSITEGQVSSLEDALRYVPGVWAASDTGNDNIFFSSRGSNLDATDYDMNGIKLLQDGLPVTAADGNNHNRIIDPLSSRYAVFARGANAMKYGAGTLGGAINFISQTAYDVSPLSLSVSGGSHGQRQTRLTAGQVFNDQLDGLVTIETKQWDGYRDHNKQDRTGVYANGGIRLTDNISSRFYLTYLNDDQELAGSLTRAQVREDRDQARPSAERDAGHLQKDVDIWRVANKTSWDIDENRRFEFGVSFEEQKLFHPIVYSPFFSLLIDNTQRDVGTMARYQHKMGDHDWLVGFNYGVTRIDGGNYTHEAGDKTGRSTKNDNEGDTLELYLMDRWQFVENWTLVAGAQAVSAGREVKVTTLSDGSVRNPEDDYNSINPRIGLVYQVSPDTSLYTNLSRLYEAPTTFQLEDGIAGNDEALDAMKGEVFEFGSRGHKRLSRDSQWGWDVSAYYAQLRDEILSIDDPAAPGTSLSTNVDDTIHAGIEALLNAELALDDTGRHRLAPLASVSWNRFRFDNDAVYGDNTLPAAPNFVMKSELLYRNNNGFYIGPTMDYVSDRYADFANSFKVGSYTLFGLKSGWSNEHFKVFAEVRNLFDRDYIASHGVEDISDADSQILNPGAPLSAYLGVEYRL
ncbi:TonB-dependent receptor family protein [Methylophaga sp. OBS4]|uniref:TonB-dependent receptor family protein n=1 Tax=Methylophaga sp. OBS4 TaxID=2991935 RepID=UPI002251F27B|nr:TonB-dependent receptor [Methylophaga sp. OBS4]MCX4186675.1 TonB-dependent receptor [Methylophaga sp. OBS4]